MYELYGDECGPDGFTPDGAPCTPDDYTPPDTQTPPDDSNPCAAHGPGWTWNAQAGTCFPTGYGTPNEGGGGEDYGDYDFPEFRGSARYPIPQIPEYKARRWNLPTLAEAQNEPGFMFGKQQGVGAIESSAAARGLLNTGGLPKQIYSWVDDYANQNYDRVVDRSFRKHTSDVAGDLAEFAPRMDFWRAQLGSNRDSWIREWEAWLQELENFRWANPSGDAIYTAGLG